MIVGLLLSLALIGRSEAEVADFSASAIVLEGSAGTEASTAVVFDGPKVDGAYTGYRFGVNVSAKDPDLVDDARQDPGTGRFSMSFQVHSSGNYDLTIRARVAGDYQRRDDGLGCRGAVAPLVIADPLLFIHDEPQSLTGLRFDKPNLNDLPYATGPAHTEIADVGPAERTAKISRRGVPQVETYTLVIQAGAVVVSDSCAVSFRMGAPSGGTQGCTACDYPGDPARDISGDGYFIDVKLDDFQCGNGFLEGDEQCDIGGENGSPSACCDSQCRQRGGDYTCRAAAGACDEAEVCDTNSPFCPVDEVKLASTPCTNDNDPCTDDVCNTVGECVHTANTAPCNDGLFCTEPDRCENLICKGATRVCPAGMSCDESADACLVPPPRFEMSMDVELGANLFTGDAVAGYTTNIVNRGGPAQNVEWISPIPPGTEFFATVSANTGAATLEEGPRGYISWKGDIGAGELVQIYYDVTVLPETACGQPIESTAGILFRQVDASAVIVVGCEASPLGACAGDCNYDDEVTVDEIIAGINGVSKCRPADVDGNKVVTTGETVMGVGSALAGCPLLYDRIAGSWSGPFLSASSSSSLLTFAFTASGNVEGPGPGLSATLTPLRRSLRIYGFSRSDGLTGVFQFSADGRHAAYIDEFGSFGALEKGASEPAASYGTADLDGIRWSGLAALYGPAERVPGAHEDFSLEEFSSFVGLTQNGFTQSFYFSEIGTLSKPLALSETPEYAELGAFEGDFKTFNDETRSGDAFFWMTPDKSFMASRTCEGPFPQCRLSGWSPLIGPYAEQCAFCFTAVPQILSCNCAADDGHEIASSIPLPCFGVIESIDGVLTCVTDASEIFVLNNDPNTRDDPASISVYRLNARGNAAPRRVITGPSTGLSNPFDFAVDTGRKEIFVSNTDASSLLVFGIAAKGDAAPLRSLSGPATGLNFPAGVTIDALHDEIFVSNGGTNGGAEIIAAYSRTASGNAPPLRQFTVPPNFHPLMLAVDPVRDEIFALGVEDEGFTSRIDVYARTAETTATPLRTIAGPSTGLVNAFGITVDPASGEIFVSNNGNDSITVYSATANGDVAPLRTIAGPAAGLNFPTQTAIDAAGGTILSTQAGSSNVTVYERNANGDAAPLRTIRGPATRLAFPLDIDVAR